MLLDLALRKQIIVDHGGLAVCRVGRAPQRGPQTSRKLVTALARDVGFGDGRYLLSGWQRSNAPTFPKHITAPCQWARAPAFPVCFSFRKSLCPRQMRMTRLRVASNTPRNPGRWSLVLQRTLGLHQGFMAGSLEVSGCSHRDRRRVFYIMLILYSEAVAFLSLSCCSRHGERTSRPVQTRQSSDCYCFCSGMSVSVLLSCCKSHKLPLSGCSLGV